MSPTRPPVVLISWVSISAGAAPLITALADPQSPYQGRVEHIYLCRRKGPDNQRESDALERSKAELRGHPLGKAAKLSVESWTTKASPIDHLAIRTFSERVLSKARSAHPDAELVIHLSPGTPSMHAIWLLLGSTGFVPGPVTMIQTADEHGRRAGNPPVQIVDVNVDSWLRRYRAMRLSRSDDIDDGRLWDPSFVRSEAMRSVMEKLGRWASSPAPVLLLGERGSGKTSLAAWLRAQSPFSNPKLEEWPVVVCGQFRANPQLAQSKLFGHAKGAFSGAHAEHVGLLEQVDGDSLFLDEIADIDRVTQRLLMAALEGRGFHRLGDNEQRRSSFRLISATNRSLDELRNERLDEDFLDRIAVFVLRVPPLRECREDLPLAWERILTRVAQRTGVEAAEVAELKHEPRIIDRLMQHPLPGNFRDLERASYHLLAAHSAGVPLASLVDAINEGLGATQATARDRVDVAHALAQLPLRDVGLDERLSESRRTWLLAAHEYARGNKTRAAEALKLERTTFNHQWKRHVEGED